MAGESIVSKLYSWDSKREKTIIQMGDIQIGGDDLTIIAGPCAVEDREQVLTLAYSMSQLGIMLFRGGAFKPRTSPYAFQGLGEKGLKILAEAREIYGVKIVTEALDCSCLDMVAYYADIIQIGARNMHNYGLLQRVGRLRKPVLLKRGFAATLDEFLLAAEYILSGGNSDVILCERGIRTFADHSRFTLDVAAIPSLKHACHLPVITDPSHSAGHYDRVLPLASASVAAGADGLMIEVHPCPSNAMSDGQQALTLDSFKLLLARVARISNAISTNETAIVA